MTVLVGSPISAVDYNAIHEKIKEILNGSASGYGDGLLESTTATNYMIATAQHWGNLVADINKCIKHQTGENIPGIRLRESTPYYYSDWATDNGFDLITKALGEQIASFFYLSSSTFGIINGSERWPLYRKPDRGGLAYWTRICTSYYANNYAGAEFITAWVSGITPNSEDYQRSFQSIKTFDDGNSLGGNFAEGVTYFPARGDLITATLVNLLASSSTVAVVNSASVHPSQLKPLNTTTVLNSGIWSGNLQRNEVYTWDGLSLIWHYNLGGYLTAGIGYQGAPSNQSDADFITFVDWVSRPGGSISTAYDRAAWTSGDLTVSDSTSTVTGVFTATVSYIKTGTNIIAHNIKISAPASASINLNAISTSSIYYSFDAITARLPSTTSYGKRLSVVPNNYSFVFKAGSISSPQLVNFINSGTENVQITAITLTNNGVQGYLVSTVTNIVNTVPVQEPLKLPLNVPAGSNTVTAVLYYTKPIQAVAQTGTFYNQFTIYSDGGTFSIPVNATVQAPEFDFDLIAKDPNSYYSYTNWQQEYGLTNTQRSLGEAIALRYYLSNDNITFNIVNGQVRYGLYRKPDAVGLRYWTLVCQNEFGSDPTLMDYVFFGGIDSSNQDLGRSLTSTKFFDNGFGNGDFYDRSLVVTTVSSSTIKTIEYYIKPKFGSIINYSPSLGNYRLDDIVNPNAAKPISVTSVNPTGPTIYFNPTKAETTGSYKTDLTVSVNAIDFKNTNINMIKTATVVFDVVDLTDGNLVSWISGFEEDNAVMGLSYDRIGGQLVLTVGFGMGADGSPELAGNGYSSAFVNPVNLGITADSQWGNLGYGEPLWKWNFSNDPFLQNYAVWASNPVIENSEPQAQEIRRTYKFIASNIGTYTYRISVDDSAVMLVDDAIIADVSLGEYSGNFNILTPGEHTVSLRFKNAFLANVSPGQNPGYVAATLTYPATNEIVWSTVSPVRNIGPYLYWREVYRIPLQSGVSKTYQLKDYTAKNTYPVSAYPSGWFKYNDYFGTAGTASAGSFMSVTDDGFGNLTFNYNGLNTISGTGADKTLTNLVNLPFYFSNKVSRKVNLESASKNNQTRKLVGVTTKGVSTILSPVPGGLKLEVVATNFNGTALPGSSYFKLNDVLVAHNLTRGHTVLVLDPNTYNIDSVKTYDTWQYPGTLLDALSMISNGKIVAISTFDACALTLEERQYLVSEFGASDITSNWSSNRLSHIFVGRKGLRSFIPVEIISSDPNPINSTNFV